MSKPLMNVISKTNILLLAEQAFKKNNVMQLQKYKQDSAQFSPEIAIAIDNLLENIKQNSPPETGEVQVLRELFTELDKYKANDLKSVLTVRQIILQKYIDLNKSGDPIPIELKSLGQEIEEQNEMLNIPYKKKAESPFLAKLKKALDESTTMNSQKGGVIVNILPFKIVQQALDEWKEVSSIDEMLARKAKESYWEELSKKMPDWNAEVIQPNLAPLRKKLVALEATSTQSTPKPDIDISTFQSTLLEVKQKLKSLLKDMKDDRFAAYVDNADFSLMDISTLIDMINELYPPQPMVTPPPPPDYDDSSKSRSPHSVDSFDPDDGDDHASLSVPHISDMPRERAPVSDDQQQCRPCDDKVTMGSLLASQLEVKLNKNIIIDAIEEINRFKKRLNTIQKMLTTEFNTNVDVNINAIKKSIEKDSTQGETIYSLQRENNIREAIKQGIKAVKHTTKAYVQEHFDFVNKGLKQKKYIQKWLRFMEAGGHYIPPQDIQLLQDYLGALASLHQDTAAQFLNKFRQNVLEKFKEFPLQMVMDVDEKQRLLENISEMYIAIDDMTNKISSFYNNKPASLMDIVFDSQFMLLYVLKIINYAGLLLSYYLAEKLFSEMYMKIVYAENKDPPSIHIMLGIVLAIHFVMNIFIFTILMLIMFLFKTGSNNFIINRYLVTSYLIDYGMTLVFVSIIALILGSIVVKKKYFRYKTEGLRGVRALREMMVSLASIVFIVPWFALF
jgi:ABC-type multidrug transport system permease subunit